MCIRDSGASGIGLASARVLAGYGASVVLLDISEQRGKEAVTSIDVYKRQGDRHNQC